MKINACVCLRTLGKLIHAMVAHLDAVTSLAVDPNGIYLMSGSKYDIKMATISHIKSLIY